MNQNKSRAELFDKAIDCSKNPFSQPQDHIISFERHISSASGKDGAVWCCVCVRDDAKTSIELIKLFGNKEVQKYTIDTVEGVYRPVVCVDNDGTVYVIWSQCDEDEWSIMFAIKQVDTDTDTIETFTIHKSQDLCFQPSICPKEGSLWISWSGYDAQTQNMCIYISEYKNYTLSSPAKAISGEFNAFRPSIAAAGSRVFLCCDISIENKYEIAWLFMSGDGSVGRLSTMGKENERWMAPRAVSSPEHTVHMAFTVIKDVSYQKYDIVDHDVGAAYVKINEKESIIVPDDSTGDEVTVACLNEGLLGKESYVPYFGARRKVYPAVLPDGQVWLLWEFRYEQDYTNPSPESKLHHIQHYGWLAGKPLRNNTWGKTQILHEGGTLYDIPAIQQDDSITISYIAQSDLAEIPEVCAQRVAPEGKEKATSDSQSEWKNWEPFSSTKNEKGRYCAKTSDGEYKLYWADTHVHSYLSPDAEGEPDELILFARDIAQLDAMAMVDNDYYPHKEFMEGEWKVQNAFAKLFTKKDKFVVFPGYEYTYHDENIANQFNHRYVLYPREGGKIFRRTDKGSKTIAELSDKLADTNALMFAHHTSWELSGKPWDQNVEVCSSWRVCIEEKDFVLKRLMAGDRFSFIGSSDTHRAVPGLGGALTGIYAKELTPEALFDAYKNHRTIATQGRKTFISLQVGDAFIGEEAIISGDPIINIWVESDVPLEFVELIRDGEAIKTIEDRSSKLKFDFTDKTAGCGNHFYFVRVKTVGDPSFNEPDSNLTHYNVFNAQNGPYRFNFARARGPFAWCSPVWVKKE